MTSARVLTIPILCGALGTSILCAGDFSNYRGFQFGMNLPVAAKQAGMKPSEAKLVHQRPAVIQELDWQPRGFPDSPVQADPVRQGLLCFYNDELFRIVIAYDRYKVEGMTASDMIQAISATYGIATKPAAEIPSELLISSRDSSGNVEIELTRDSGCAASGGGVRLGHAAVAVADLPGWYDSHYGRVGV